MPHDGRSQTLEVISAIVASTIDVEGRRAQDSACLATGQVTLDSFSYSRRTPVVLEALAVQAQLERVPVQIRFCKRLLMLEQILVHSPEICLCSSRFSGGCRGARPWMGFPPPEKRKKEKGPFPELPLKTRATVVGNTRGGAV